jgi:hypothetical protein
VIYTRAVAVLAGMVYVVLWALALHGDPNLVPVLVVPPVLAVLVAVGVWLNNFVGITPRAVHFVERDEVAPSEGAPSALAPSPDASTPDASDERTGEDPAASPSG